MSVKEIIDKAIAENGDVWKPSPSSMYPMIGKLIDQGLN
jgi:DNA-binding PadR family transcriptional regulator